jgi:hypothetical protein
MSEVRSALAALLWLGLSSSAEGQSAREWERRVDSLSRVAQRAAAARQRYDDSVTAAVRRLDTVRAEPITVLSEPELLPVSRAVALAARDSVARSFGKALERIAGYAFVLRQERPRDVDSSDMAIRGIDDTVYVEISVLSPAGREGSGGRVLKDEAAVAAALTSRIVRILYASDGPLYGWLASQIPDDSVRTSDWLTYRLALISSRTPASRDCYDGDVHACAVALQLVPADPVLEWHDATTRREYVAQHVAAARRIDGRAAAGCVAGSDSACISVMRRLPLPPPIRPKNRVGLASLALSLGGPGAGERLLAGGTLREKIAGAAGMPADSVLRLWQQSLRTARAPSRDLSAEIVMVSVAWIIGLGVLSTRSSRWR